MFLQFVQRKDILAGLAFAALVFAWPSFAQEVVPEAATEQPVTEQSAAERPPVATQDASAATPAAPESTLATETFNRLPGTNPAKYDVSPNAIGPMLFTFWENSAINEALVARGKSGAIKRMPEGETGEEIVKPPPEEREIKLGGILYVSSSDWIVWLNGKRVTPKALPKEVLDLKVYEKYVEIRWFDEYTNQVFPIRLRPHERFNIDSRVFIPG